MPKRTRNPVVRAKVPAKAPRVARPARPAARTAAERKADARAAKAEADALALAPVSAFDAGATQLPVASAVPDFPLQKQPVDRALIGQRHVAEPDPGYHRVFVSDVAEMRRLVAVAEQETGYAQKEAIVHIRTLLEGKIAPSTLYYF